jgi:hypothetical protein
MSPVSPKCRCAVAGDKKKTALGGRRELSPARPSAVTGFSPKREPCEQKNYVGVIVDATESSPTYVEEMDEEQPKKVGSEETDDDREASERAEREKIRVARLEAIPDELLDLEMKSLLLWHKFEAHRTNLMMLVGAPRGLEVRDTAKRALDEYVETRRAFYALSKEYNRLVREGKKDRPWISPMLSGLFGGILAQALPKVLQKAISSEDAEKDEEKSNE